MSFADASVIETVQLSTRLRRIALQVDRPEALAAEAADCDELDVTVVPTLGTGNGHAPSRLAQLVREFPLPEAP